MGSKKRIMTNFSSDEIYDFIYELAQKTGRTLSSITEEMIRITYEERDKYPSLYRHENDNIKNKNQLPQGVYARNLVISRLRFSDEPTTANFSNRQGINLEFTVSDLLVYKNKTQEYSQELDLGVLKERIEHQALKKFTDMGKLFSHLPDFYLTFISAIKIKYSEKMDSSLSFKISADRYTIPIYLNDLVGDKLHYDFLNIQYRTFSDVVKNGWNRKKYSHLLYIDNASKSRSSGPFIGLLHKKQSLPILIKDGKKISKHNELLKYNKIYEINPRGHQGETKTSYIKFHIDMFGRTIEKIKDNS